jgi:hypothetical protein
VAADKTLPGFALLRGILRISGQGRSQPGGEKLIPQQIGVSRVRDGLGLFAHGRIIGDEISENNHFKLDQSMINHKGREI